ncbi:hypothetical protein [Taibaiella koreensis]|uniref:hypothetical protein n=1 Tax=Taibaiella koreensis TaxID=1268548 RepID=UPI0013C30DF5|nr:hypothetical protein [Taibaiella koreensis]
MRLLFGTLLALGLLSGIPAPAQEQRDSAKTVVPDTTNVKPASSAGFQLLPKLGLGMSRNFLVDIGLIGYSYIPDKSKSHYYDANISVMTYIGRHTMVMPKLDLQASLFPIDHEELLCFNVGLDAGLLTDFRQSAIMLTPKAGFSLATGLLRLYYLHNFLLRDKTLFPGYGRHGVLLEINISVLQGKGFKLM